MKNFKTTPIRFGPGAYTILKNLPGSLVGIFSEFIDNSLSSYQINKQILEKIDGPPFKLKITIEKIGDTIVIEDNAAGIDEKNFQRALQPANKPENTEEFNEFGMGMKYAAVWISNKWELESSVAGEPESRKTTFVYKEVIEKQLEELEIEYKKKELNKHGTKVTLSLLESKHINPWRPKKIIERLSSIYRNYIRPDGTFQSKFKKYDVEIIVFGEKLSWVEHGFLKQQWYEDRQIELKNTPEIEWKHELKRQAIICTVDEMDSETGIIKSVDKELFVSGFVGILPDGNQAHKNGFVITRRGRVVEGYDQRVYPAAISSRSSRSFQYVRIYGELNFDSPEVEISFDKTQLSISQDIRDMCFSQIAHELKSIYYKEYPDKPLNLIKQANEYRAKFSRTEVKKGIEKFNDYREKREDSNFNEQLNEVGNLQLDQTYHSGKTLEVSKVSNGDIIPQEFKKNIQIENENWEIGLNWINNDSLKDLYMVNFEYETQKLKIFLNMAHDVIINNRELKEDVHFMDFVFCLAISELKAKNSGAQNVELVRYAFNEYIRILKS